VQCGTESINNGANFVVDQVRDPLRQQGVTILLSPPYTPRYNGACEAGLGALKNRRIAVSKTKRWLEELREKASDALQLGSSEWYEYQTKKDGERIYLEAVVFEGKELIGRYLKNVDLSGSEFTNCNFSGSEFHDCDLSDVKFHKCNMDKCILSNTTLRGITIIHGIHPEPLLQSGNAVGITIKHTVFRSANANPRANFNGCDLEQVSFIDCAFPGTDWTKAKMDGVHFDDCNVSGATFDQAVIARLCFARCNLSESSMASASAKSLQIEKSITTAAKFSGTKVEKMKCEGGDFSGSDLSDMTISGTMKGCNFSSARISNAKFVECDLAGSGFIRSNCHGMAIVKSDLTRVSFELANLTRASIEETIVNSETSFKDANLQEVSCDRYFIEQLNVSHGKMTVGQKMVMDIYDPVANLRSDFSGIWRAIHAVSFSAFVAPYVFFALKTILLSIKEYRIQMDGMTVALIASAPREMGLWEALLLYISTGGGGKEINYLATTSFSIALVYNIYRFALLAITDRYETLEHATGVPRKINIRRIRQIESMSLWEKCRNYWWPYGSLGTAWHLGENYAIYHKLFWLNIAAVAVHSWFFLTKSVIYPF
jgi:uncharacterized protein YjbI with pentapeptide repeats